MGCILVASGPLSGPVSTLSFEFVEHVEDWEEFSPVWAVFPLLRSAVFSALGNFLAVFSACDFLAVCSA
jgi:hypothetical protein